MRYKLLIYMVMWWCFIDATTTVPIISEQEWENSQCWYVQEGEICILHTANRITALGAKYRTSNNPNTPEVLLVLSILLILSMLFLVLGFSTLLLPSDIPYHIRIVIYGVQSDPHQWRINRKTVETSNMKAWQCGAELSAPPALIFYHVTLYCVFYLSLDSWAHM